MKRKIAILLVFVMVFYSGLTAYASSDGTSVGSKQKSTRQEYSGTRSGQVGEAAPGEDALPDLAELERQVQAGHTGQVDVVIETVLVLQKPVKFSVSLQSPQGQSVTRELELEGRSAEEKRVSFEGLAEGIYTLKVTAEGFSEYTQNLAVENKANTVKLTTGFLAGISYEPGIPHPGVLLIGDVNGDGGTDEADKKALIDSIDSKVPTGASDLNHDDNTNLIDLEYFVHGFGETGDIQAAIEKSVPAAVIEPQVGVGTIVDAADSDMDAAEALEKLLRNQASVTLRREDGAAISAQSPVALEFTFGELAAAVTADGILIETGRDNPIREAEIKVAYTDENGPGEVTIPVTSYAETLLKAESCRAEMDQHGNIRIYLGSQVAMKKVTFTIMGMQNNNNLAEISKVEFVNGMEERIPEPEMNIPVNLRVQPGNKSISVSWDSESNVTGYEVLIRQGEQQETVLTSKNSMNISSFQGKKLANYITYQVSVQSVNGSWRSGYGPEESVTPKPNGRPDKPDSVTAVGKYQSVTVSWKRMEDTTSYNLYYKESAAGEYQKVGQLPEDSSSYTIGGLKDMTEYTVYVTGANEFGESDPSLLASATTKSLDPAQMPRYNLINTGQKGEAGAHIVNAVMNGEMKGSLLDTQKGTAWGTVDHDTESYYVRGTWDDGGYNAMSLNHGLTYEFDQVYKMDTIAFLEAIPQEMHYSYVKVRYWKEDGTQVDSVSASVQMKNDSAGRPYYVVKLSEPVEAKKIQFGLARYLATGNVAVNVSEVYFYYYDVLMDEIMALYEDDLHTVLRADVTQETIDSLRTRIQAVDPESGEYHPDREILERELDTAEAILKDAGLQNALSVKVHSGITTQDVNRGFGGLNAWQPLGVTVAAQEEIMVYVGHNTKKTGENTELKLIATQYHAEASSMSREVATLKVGANKITIPKIWTTTGLESGGALYVQYTGNDSRDQYAVRVSGGVQVPGLDLYQVSDAGERLARVKEYVEKLQTYVAQMESLHGQVHQNSENGQVAYGYAKENCILGASDILLDTMMLSLPAEQILAGAGNGDTGQKAQKILNSMDAMEEMMYLFYQHKGLNASAQEAVNQIPKTHLNIRYQRMFSGAFMYASGNHIGIEWGSAPGMMGGVPVQSDNGKYVSGSYFGWGIAHEIGHCINQGTYAIAEITNNYYAVLARAKDNNGSVRFQYENVYDKVTSGTRGRASNVFTQLGMYWQLHLAYDKGYNYRTYENYDEQLANLFYARVDTYARTPAKAPAPGGVALELSKDRDQDFMRLCCAAAQKDILDFFERWGMTPNEVTRGYAAQFEKENRAIYYVSDDSRVYSLQGGASMLGTSGAVEAVGGSVTAAVDSTRANQVNITLSSQNIPESDILGYEIVRCTIAGGRTVRETAGFVTGNNFSDTLSVNNRVVWYEITLIDKYLNRSAVRTLEPLKIEHDGSMDKSFFTVSTQNLTVAGEKPLPENADSLCSAGEEDLVEGNDGQNVSSVRKLLDNDVNTVYTATAGGTAEMTVELNKTLTVAGLKYTAGDSTPAGDYEIQVRAGNDWTTVATGTFGQEQGSTIYFANPAGEYVSTYATDAVKWIWKVAGGSQISIAELDVLGPVGDNVKFRKAGSDTVTIGKLTEDYPYAEGKVIPKDSVVFAGAYKGSPAYNVLILYDQDGNIVGGTDGNGALKAQQIILADPPETGNIGNVSDGTWIYWVEPDQQIDLSGLKKVRAELYRVNDAQTNEGQRLVSDSLYEVMPAGLPGITLK